MPKQTPEPIEAPQAEEASAPQQSKLKTFLSKSFTGKHHFAIFAIGLAIIGAATGFFAYKQLNTKIDEPIPNDFSDTKKEDEKKAEKKDSDGATQPAGKKLTLTGTPVKNGIKLSWKATGYTPNHGFQLYIGKDEYTNLSGTSYTFDYPDGKTYTFKVCSLVIDDTSVDTPSCSGTKSNAVTYKMPLVKNQIVQAGDVNLTAADDKLTWTFAGTAPRGFIVYWGHDDLLFNSYRHVREGTSYPFELGKDSVVMVCKYMFEAEFYDFSGVTDCSKEIKG